MTGRKGFIFRVKNNSSGRVFYIGRIKNSKMMEFRDSIDDAYIFSKEVSIEKILEEYTCINFNNFITTYNVVELLPVTVIRIVNLDEKKSKYIDYE